MAGNAEKPALILAEMCNPAWASVPLVGWRHVSHLAEKTSIHLVTHEINRPEIEKQDPQFPVTYIPFDIFDRFFDWFLEKVFGNDYSSVAITLLKIPFYLWFEFRVWRRLSSLIRQGKFSLIHRLTPVSPVIPSIMARLAFRHQLPFVLGPINGGLPWPPGYESASRDREWLSNFRKYYKYLPFIASTRKCSAIIFVGSQFTMKEVPQEFHGKCRYLPENGVDQSLIAATPRDIPQGVMRVAFVGRLVALKGPDIVLKACLSLLSARKIKLDIVGDGPLMHELRAITEANELTDQVQFHGWIDEQSKVQKLMENFHVLAFPSVREFGGGVVVEAMAKGVVPIVMDYGGPGEIVTEESGIKLPLENQEKTVERLNMEITRLLADKQRWARLANGARDRIYASYTWQSKAKKIIESYQELSRGKSK